MSQRQDPSIIQSFIVATLFGYGAYKIEPTTTEMQWAGYFCMLVAGLSAWTIIKTIPGAVYNWLLRRRAKRATDNHGSAQWADEKSIVSYGLHAAIGLFLAVSIYTGAPMFHRGEGHWMVYAPTRSGKTRSLVLTNILHNFGSMFITDIKGELWDVTSHACRTIQKNVVYRLDPAGLKDSTHGIAARYNPMNRIIEAWKTGRHSDVIIKAKAMALQLLPEPAQADQNAFFRNGSRKVIVFVMVYLVVTSDDETTLTQVVALIQDNMLMQDALQMANCLDVLSGDLARIAKDLLRKLEATDSNHWESFCEGAVQVLDIYSESGFLAESTSTCDFLFRELKETDLKVFVLVDPIRMSVLAQWLGLINWCMLDELMSCGINKEVILMLDEASNFRVDGLVEKLTLLAGYQCRAIVILQSFSAFEKTYSKQDLDILLDQCECRIWLKVQSYRVAEQLSKSLGRKTLVNTQHNLGHNYLDLARENMSEIARPLMTPDEIMQSPHCIIQLRGKAPILGDVVGYDAVQPWNKWAQPNTLYGNKPFISKTRIRLKYPSLSWWRTCFGLIKRKPRVTYFRRIKHKRNYSGLPFALIHIFRALLFIVPILAIWWVIENHGTPHVLWEYSTRGYSSSPIKERCIYIGIDGQKTRFGPDCPFIKFID